MASWRLQGRGAAGREGERVATRKTKKEKKLSDASFFFSPSSPFFAVSYFFSFFFHLSLSLSHSLSFSSFALPVSFPGLSLPSYSPHSTFKKKTQKKHKKNNRPRPRHVVLCRRRGLCRRRPRQARPPAVLGRRQRRGCRSRSGRRRMARGLVGEFKIKNRKREERES